MKQPDADDQEEDCFITTVSSTIGPFYFDCLFLHEVSSSYFFYFACLRKDAADRNGSSEIYQLLYNYARGDRPKSIEGMANQTDLVDFLYRKRRKNNRNLFFYFTTLRMEMCLL